MRPSLSGPRGALSGPAARRAGGAGPAGRGPAGGQLLRGARDRVPPGAGLPAALPRPARRRLRRRPGAPALSVPGLGGIPARPAQRVQRFCRACVKRLVAPKRDDACSPCLAAVAAVGRAGAYGSGQSPLVRKSQRPLSMPARAARARGSRRPHACMQVATVQDMQAATRRLCHSQLSWFRSEPAYAWVDASPPADAVAAAIAAAVEGDCVPAGERPPAFQPAWHTRDQRGMGGNGRRGRLLAALVLLSPAPLRALQVRAARMRTEHAPGRQACRAGTGGSARRRSAPCGSTGPAWSCGASRSSRPRRWTLCARSWPRVCRTACMSRPRGSHDVQAACLEHALSILPIAAVSWTLKSSS